MKRIKHKDKRILNETARRAMVGALTIHDGKTTFDPTGHMMNKSTNRIFNVNKNDFETMLDEHGMTEEEGIAHLELISSLPVLRSYKGEFIIENDVAMPSLRSSVPMRNFSDASYSIEGSDIAEETIDVIILPAGTGKTTYSKQYDTFTDVDDIIGTEEALKINRPLIEQESWNELTEAQTTQMLKYLPNADPSQIYLIHHKNQFDERLNVRILYMARLPKAQMMQIAEERGEKDELHETATITNWKNSNYVPIRSRAEITKQLDQIALDRRSDDVLAQSEFEIPKIIVYENAWPSSWEAVVTDNGEHAPVFWTKDLREYSSPRAANFLEAARLDARKYKMIPYTEYNSYRKVRSAFKQFILDNQSSPEVHLWIQGTLSTKAGPLTISMMAEALSEDIMSDARSIGRASTQIITSYWKSSILQSRDMYAHYANRRPPSRIPVIGCRVSNWGMRLYDTKAALPQLCTPSTLYTSLGLPRTLLIDAEAKYLNYSKHVKLRPITEAETLELDYAWKRSNSGHYTMSLPVQGTFTISNPAFMNGFSSVCTSAHSTYGYGRDPSELVFQMTREIDSGHGTSGHMIASCLMFRAHLLLYLNDVHYNNTTNKSIYNLEVKEPTSGRYHTNQEYKHAIDDINTLMQSTDFATKFARNNLAVLTAFVNVMK